METKMTITYDDILKALLELPEQEKQYAITAFKVEDWYKSFNDLTDLFEKLTHAECMDYLRMEFMHVCTRHDMLRTILRDKFMPKSNEVL